jgi:polysaccharide pyruvyl transferase WcaK-like protein
LLNGLWPVEALFRNGFRVIEKYPLRIGLLGQFGIGNLGNEASLQAMLDLLKRRAPQARITCICTDPDWVSRTYGLDCRPIRARGTGRLGNIVHAIREARKLDLLLVPGTGVFDDFNESPFGSPYEWWRWCHAARLAGARIAFVSVGAGPITRRLSRIFIMGAAHRADYRSYRDAPSKAFMDSIGMKRPNDPVFPDLAFSLPTPPVSPKRDDGSLTVAVGVMAYYGWAGGGRGQGQGIYDTYIDKLAGYIAWLAATGRRVKFVIGGSKDAAAVEDARARALAIDPSCADAFEPFVAATTLDDVMRQMAEADIAVVTRFHNLVAALRVGRPAISLGYAEKNHALLMDMGLGDFSQDVETFDLERLKAQTEVMIAQRAAHSAAILQHVADYEAQLARQEELLASRFAIA